MKKVYVLTSGSYSDYRINAIFSTIKLAEEFKKFVPGDDYNEIAVYEIDPDTVDLLKRGYSIWIVTMLIDGTTESCTRHEVEPYYVSDVGSKHIWRRTEAPAYKGSEMPDALNSTVWAKTAKHAVKIVNEQRTQMIANGEWK